MQQKIALITGANRGIGFAMVDALMQRGDTVVWMGVRDLEEGAKVARVFNDGRVKVVYLDVALPRTVLLAKEMILAQEGRGVDILVNNAGVLYRGNVLQANTEEVLTSFNVNVMGAYHVIRAFVPEMIAQDYGRIVNISSGWGSFGEGLEGPFAYSMSKAALNALTLILSHELPSNVKVNAVSPGWVQTRMVDFTGPNTPKEAAESILWLTQLPPDGPTGQFFRGNQQIPW